MTAEMRPDELTMRAVGTAWGCWRVLPKGRADILFLVAADLQTRQGEGGGEA